MSPPGVMNTNAQKLGNVKHLALCQIPGRPLCSQLFSLGIVSERDEVVLQIGWSGKESWN